MDWSNRFSQCATTTRQYRPLAAAPEPGCSRAQRDSGDRVLRFSRKTSPGQSCDSTVCLSVCLPHDRLTLLVCQSFSMSVCLSVRLSVVHHFLSASLSICLSVFLCLSDCLSAYLSV